MTDLSFTLKHHLMIMASSAAFGLRGWTRLAVRRNREPGLTWLGRYQELAPVRVVRPRAFREPDQNSSRETRQPSCLHQQPVPKPLELLRPTYRDQEVRGGSGGLH